MIPFCDRVIAKMQSHRQEIGQHLPITLRHSLHFCNALLKKILPPLYICSMFDCEVQAEMGEGKECHCLFLDLAKAYDSVEYWALEDAMRALGVPEKILKLMATLDRGAEAKVMTGGLLAFVAYPGNPSICWGAMADRLRGARMGVSIGKFAVFIVSNALRRSVSLGGRLITRWNGSGTLRRTSSTSDAELLLPFVRDPMALV